MKLSAFGERFAASSGIHRLMEDLGDALAGDEGILMLGGGNPSHIPAMERIFHERMTSLLSSPGAFPHIIGDYDPPQGNGAFIASLAALLRRELGWDVGSKNIALTNGSQSSFFMLFNMFAGNMSHGGKQRILLPMVPEYIGYTDVGLNDDFFIACKPKVERIDDHSFKYRVDFDALKVDESIAAICVSRPTNPTGNVLSDDEIARLDALAAAHQIPLIIDGAYGLPFPRIWFTDAQALWHPQMIACLSLSKLGLPGTRTGMVIASSDIIREIANMNAVFNLATGSLGPALAEDLVASGEIIGICQRIITPYYRAKAEQAIDWLHEALAGLDWLVHKAEGAMFLWLWFPDLKPNTEILYQRLKRRGVLVLAGHHFFPGLIDAWSHQHECIRLTYAQDGAVVKRGIGILAEEVRRLSVAA